MTSKFNVGDRVRVTSDLYDTYRERYDKTTPLVGDVGVITGEKTSGTNFYVIVRFDGTTLPTNGIDDGWRFGEEDVELVEEATTTFNIGDRVRLTADGVAWLRGFGVNDASEGIVGTVIETYEGETSVGVEFPELSRPRFGSDYGEAEGWAMPNGRIELVDSNEGGASTVESRKFSKGDRVRIVGESLQAIRDANDVEVDEAMGTITGVSAWGDDAYGVLADDKRLRSFTPEGTWSVEASDIEHLDTPAKSSPAEIDIVAALQGDDRKAMNDGTLVVDGEKLDVEAMFYRMCAKATKRTRRRSA